MSAVVESQQVPEGERIRERHVFEPHRTGVPPLGAYLRDLWARRDFVLELARTTLRAQHFNTTLGQLWLVINPLLLGLVAFNLVSTSIQQGARSVVGGGRLILNSAFPRTVLPLASVLTAFMRFLPTLGVYAVVHAVAGLPVGLHLLWAIPILGLLLVFAAGAAMIAAAAQVYIRDLTNILPYFLRIWLYVSPVLYYADEIPSRFKPL